MVTMNRSKSPARVFIRFAPIRSGFICEMHPFVRVRLDFERVRRTENFTFSYLLSSILSGIIVPSYEEMSSGQIDFQ